MRPTSVARALQGLIPPKIATPSSVVSRVLSCPVTSTGGESWEAYISDTLFHSFCRCPSGMPLRNRPFCGLTTLTPTPQTPTSPPTPDSTGRPPNEPKHEPEPERTVLRSFLPPNRERRSLLQVPPQGTFSAQGGGFEGQVFRGKER